MIAIVVTALSLLYSRADTTVIIVVRHAEKQLGTIDDPPLAPQGEERAQRLASLFGSATLGPADAVYATSTRRAQATAAPVAGRLGLPITTSDASPDELARRIIMEHHGGTVLVVGHTNTVPQLVSRLARQDALGPMSDDEYNIVYIVSRPDFGEAAVTTLRY